MAAGIISFSSIPGWPSPPDGLVYAVENALTVAHFPSMFVHTANGFEVSDISTAMTAISSYIGGVAQLTYHKTQKQAALDDFFNAHFDLAAFIRGGSATGITGAQVGTFLATITNNYRTLRASIAAAANVATVDAINVLGGWPNNP